MAESVMTDAVLLRRVPFGESDLIVTLFTREVGKVTALARAARRSRRRFGGALELGVLVTAELRGKPGSDLWTLLSATPRQRFAIGDVAELAHASYGAELLRELTGFEQPEPSALELILELYRAIAELGPRAEVLRRYELALLELV